MKKTVLIFGISSFVGSNLAQLLKDDYRVVGTYFKTPVSIPGITSYPCDILKRDYVTSLVGMLKPDITIYAIGMSSLTACKLNPKMADALNSVGVANACRSSERVGSKFVLISSSFVLSGDNISFKEVDIPLPGTAYGNSMSAAEFFVQRSCINYLVLRTCPLYGLSYNPLHPNWFEYVQEALAKGQPLESDDSVSTGYLDIGIFSRILKTCIEANVTNRLLQVSSQNIMTRFQFAQLYARTFKQDEALIVSSKIGLPKEGQDKRAQASSKHLSYQMDTTNLESVVGAKLPKIEESLQFTFKRMSPKISAKNS